MFYGTKACFIVIFSRKWVEESLLNIPIFKASLFIFPEICSFKVFNYIENVFFTNDNYNMYEQLGVILS